MPSPLDLLPDLPPETLDSVARVRVQKNGTLVGAEPCLDLIEGTNVALTVADDQTNSRITATITVASAAPSGAAGGTLGGTYPNPTVNTDGTTIETSSNALRVKAGGIGANELASTTVAAGTYGSSSAIPVVTIDADGRITNATTVAPTASTLGTIGYVAVTANQTGISTVTDLTSLTLTFTAVAGRRYKISGKGLVQQQTLAGTAAVTIWTGATQLGGAGGTLIATGVLTCEPVAIVVPGAGSITYKLRLATTAGTVDLVASSTDPAFILIEDIGT